MLKNSFRKAEAIGREVLTQALRGCGRARVGLCLKSTQICGFQGWIRLHAMLLVESA